MNTVTRVDQSRLLGCFQAPRASSTRSYPTFRQALRTLFSARDRAKRESDLLYAARVFQCKLRVGNSIAERLDRLAFDVLSQGE